MLLLGHWPALVGADARLFELRPVAGIDGSSLMGHRVGSCAFSPITLVDSAIPIISVLEPPEEALHRGVVRAAALPRHRPGQPVPLAYGYPAGPAVVAAAVRAGHGPWPSERVPHASSRLLSASSASGLVPIDQAARPPSKQSRMGDG